MRREWVTAMLLVGATVAGTAGAAKDGQDAHAQAVALWHKERLARLTSEGGWLSLVGLHWLQEGENVAGSDPASTLRFPAAAPQTVGRFVRKDGKVLFTAAPGVTVTENGKPVTTVEMRADADGNPTVLTTGSFTFHVIKRGTRLGVRLKDSNAPTRLQFKGIERYPVDARWNIQARFEPFATPRKVKVPTVLGTTDEMESPGAVVFTVDGKEHRLEPVVEAGDKEMFFIFADATSGKETYGAGRFLYTPLPVDGKVQLDFNRAYNPPCAFTKFATCPLPPPQNRLKIAVTAGEKKYGDH